MPPSSRAEGGNGTPQLVHHHDHGGPRIGVTGPDRGARASRWFTALALQRAGAIPVFLRPRGASLAALDGFVVSGGDDVDPRLYGGTPDRMRRLDPERDRFELALIDHAITRDLPLLGICRGAQLLDVYAGGTLRRVHRSHMMFPWRRVAVRHETALAASLGRDTCWVNAFHDYAIDRIGRELVPAARDSDRAYVQAVERPGSRFVIGVQWHPEYLPWRDAQARLFRALVAAAQEIPLARHSPVTRSPTCTTHASSSVGPAGPATPAAR